MTTLREIKQLAILLDPYLPKGTKILNQKIAPLTTAGENYGSVMQQIDVTIQEPFEPPRDLHLVGKRIPASELLCEVFNIQKTFKKEMNMYLEVIPALVKFDEEYGKVKLGIGELFAKFYGARINLKPGNDLLDKDGIILLENLKLSGYKVEDRLTGFDKEFAYRILEDLAKFHAVPLAFKIKKPDEFERIILPVIKGVAVDDNFDDSAKQSAVNEILDCVKDLEECKPYLDKISDAIYACINNNYGLLDKAVQPFATIVHTDYWVNNTMVLKDAKNKPIKNKIIDLQLPVYNSGTRDLLFFLYSSVRPDVLNNNLDIFLKFYYGKFIEFLRNYDVTVNQFSWHKFNEELKRNTFCELGHILVMYKPIFLKRGAINDMSAYNVDDMLRRDTVTADYEVRVKNCITSFIKHKWI